MKKLRNKTIFDKNNISVNRKYLLDCKDQMHKALVFRILSIACAVCLMFSLVLNVLALSTTRNIQSAEQVINQYSNNKEVKYTISSQKNVLGISGDSTYTIYKLKPYGFAILLDDTNGLMEACYSENAIIPIDVKSNDQCYYGGPGVYCIRENGRYLNTFNGKFLSSDDVSDRIQLERSASQYELKKSNITSSKENAKNYIPGVSTISVENHYFENLVNYGNNVNGTCTVIATAMLFGYYDNYVDESFVPTQYEEGNGTTESFHQLLNDFVYGNSTQEAIFIHEALPGINAYLDSQTVWADMVSDYSSQTSVINNIINNLATGVPAIGSMGTHLGAEYNHTALIYGVHYHNSDPTNTATFTVHMGMGNSGPGYVIGGYNVYTASASWFYECGYLQFY